MAYDPGLAQRLRELLAHEDGISEKAMFGGLAFMYGGRMLVGIVRDTLMARVGLLAYEQALAQPHVRVMDFTGKPMKGYVFVDPPALKRDSDLARWVGQCQDFVRSLPPR